MILQCQFCEQDSAGNHASNCPMKYTDRISALEAALAEKTKRLEEAEAAIILHPNPEKLLKDYIKKYDLHEPSFIDGSVL